MGIRFKLILSFLASFALIGAISLYVLQWRLQAEFAALEQTEVQAALSRSIAVADAIPVSLLSLTLDWAVWTDMHDFAIRPKQLAAWAVDNIGEETALNVDFSLFEILDPQANIIHSVQTGKDGAGFALDATVRQALVRRYADDTAAPGCFFQHVNGLPALVCAARITPSQGGGSYAGVFVAARMFSEARLRDLQTKTGFPVRLIGAVDIPSAVQWNTLEPAGPHIGMGRYARHTEPDTNALVLPLRGFAEQPALSLEVRVPRAIQFQSQSLSRYVLMQTLLTSFATVVLLALVVHSLLVKRLRAFHQQLVGMGNGRAWSRRLTVSGSDEIGALAVEVNGLLDVIETQMKELTLQSLTDPLTDLPNRRAFDMRLALEFSRGRREHQMLALLIIDVDCFKRYNDRYGHPQGDVALRTVAQVLNSVSTRALDLAARVGGEEFALMLPASSAEGAAKIASDILSVLADKAVPHADSTVSHVLTVSIGVALLAEGDTSPAALVSRADQALYAAKAGGRNRFVVDRGPEPATLQAQD